MFFKCNYYPQSDTIIIPHILAEIKTFLHLKDWQAQLYIFINKVAVFYQKCSVCLTKYIVPFGFFLNFFRAWGSKKDVFSVVFLLIIYISFIYINSSLSSGFFYSKYHSIWQTALVGIVWHSRAGKSQDYWTVSLHIQHILYMYVHFYVCIFFISNKK